MPCPHIAEETLQEARRFLSMSGDARFPILYIPPISGSMLEMQLDQKEDMVHWWCERSTRGWEIAWLDVWRLLPGSFDCLSQIIRLGWDEASRSYTASPRKVKVRPVRSYSGATSLTGDNATAIFNCIADPLESLGWPRTSLQFAHSYDWRRAADGYMTEDGDFAALKRQIEGIRNATGLPVVAVALSMGANYFHLFLTSGFVDEDWKALHVRAFVSTSGFWAGTLRPVLSLVSGVWGGLERYFFQRPLIDFMRGIPALSWMASSPLAGSENKTVVYNVATGREYRTADIPALLRDVGADQAADVWEKVEPYRVLDKAPNVEAFCFYGKGVPTISRLDYLWESFLGPSVQHLTDEGDGAVLQPSLELCRTWSEKQKYPATVKSFPGVVHETILQDARAVDAVVIAIVSLHAAASREERLQLDQS
eukprot:jgi/Botrbrau1/10120/Bobra.20_2s0026.2